MKIYLTILVALVICAYVFQKNSYSLDENHSRLSFSATHFGVSQVEGNFKVFEATLKSEKEDFSDAVIEMTADINSINTEVAKRDKDLLSANWFDTEKYPKLMFKSKVFKKLSEKSYKLEGNITMHGVTKPIVFEVIYNGKYLNPMSKQYAVGFTVSGKLNRKDFGIGTELFAAAVGNEIELKSNVEFIINQPGIVKQ